MKMCFNEAWKAIWIIYELLRLLFTIKKSNAQDKWSLERSDAQRNLCATNLALCFLIFQRIVPKKLNRFILCRALTTCSMRAPHCLLLSHSFSLSFIGDFNYISFGLNLFTGVNYFLKRFFCISVSLSFFLGNEKTINHCTNEVRVWATLTSIFLMPFFFDSVSFFFLL